MGSAPLYENGLLISSFFPSVLYRCEKTHSGISRSMAVNSRAACQGGINNNNNNINKLFNLTKTV
jgi:hypothetical protein